MQLQDFLKLEVSGWWLVVLVSNPSEKYARVKLDIFLRGEKNAWNHHLGVCFFQLIVDFIHPLFRCFIFFRIYPHGGGFGDFLKKLPKLNDPLFGRLPKSLKGFLNWNWVHSAWGTPKNSASVVLLLPSCWWDFGTSSLWYSTCGCSSCRCGKCCCCGCSCGCGGCGGVFSGFPVRLRTWEDILEPMNVSGGDLFMLSLKVPFIRRISALDC